MLIFKVNGVFKRCEYKVKFVRILYIEIEKKIHFGKGDGIENDPAKGKGWLLQYPGQARHKENGKGKQEQYPAMNPYFFWVQFIHQEYPPKK